MLRLYDLKAEYHILPNAVDIPHPRFSWKAQSDQKNVHQVSYRIVAYTDDAQIWDSGIVESDESRFVPYDGEPLQSRQKVSWRVTAVYQFEKKDGSIDRETTEGCGAFQMGLLQESDWQGQWITADVNGALDRPAKYLRRSFCVRPGLKEARIYQTAHGLYESFFNGLITDEDKFKPGFTSYYYRIQYQTYDITQLLTEGKNIWAVRLADGWWRGVTGGSVRNNFGKSLDYLGQVELAYEDGTVEIVGTDTEFKTAPGGLLVSDMLMGDIFDARMEPQNWMYPNYDDLCWEPVKLTSSFAEGVLKQSLAAKKIASRGVPVREMERFSGKAFRDSAGNLVLDFGQNIAGYVHMKLRGTKPGQQIRLVHGETLDHDGVFTMCNVDKTSLPLPRFQEVIYRCAGKDTEEYKPAFSIFGFRYVLVEGYDEPIEPGDFTAIAVYSAMEETASFVCSHDLINKLVKNAMWSQKGNFMDVPVDCPTRERNSWTGDAQVYVRTACTLMNTYSFYEKWLQDQTLEQYASGKVGITFPSTSSVHDPDEVAVMKLANPLNEIAGPTGNGNIGEDATGWGDAAVWVPYSVYLYFGDKTVLENQYETAKRWLEFELNCAREENPAYLDLPQYQRNADGSRDADFIFDTKFHYGEWNEAFGIQKKVEEYYAQRIPFAVKSIKTLEERLEAQQKSAAMVQYVMSIRSKTGNAVVATAYMARSAENVAHMARILDKKEDADHYATIAEKIREVYAKYLVQDDGTIEKGHQAPYVRALEMNMCGDKKELVLQQLLAEVEANDFALNTGFLSTPFLLPVLCDNGHSEIAYRILENENLPGWLYPVKKGMTTIPESWGGIDLLEDSLNHYSYGAVCEFLYQYTAGIRPMEETPGYRHFLLQPIPGGSLTHALARLETPYGEILSKWEKAGNEYHYSCTIPANSTAHLILPDGRTYSLGSGTYHFSWRNTA